MCVLSLKSGKSDTRAHNGEIMGIISQNMDVA